MLDILVQFLPILAALMIASVGYVKNTASASSTDFDVVKFGSTLIVGAGVTVIMFITGDPISTESLSVQIIAYSGLIVLVEQGLKIVVRGAVNIPISWVNAFLPEANKIAASASTSDKSVKAVSVAPVAAAGVSDQSASSANDTPKAASAASTTPASGEADTITHISLKTYPSTLTGVSPFTAEYFLCCNPNNGIHQPVKAIIDHGDNSPIEEVPIKDGIVQIRHVYNYSQALNLVDLLPSPYYSKVFYPRIIAMSADGLKGELNNPDKINHPDAGGESHIITVKDAAAVLAGKV